MAGQIKGHHGISELEPILIVPIRHSSIHSTLYYKYVTISNWIKPMLHLQII